MTPSAASPVEEALAHIVQGSDFPAFAQQMREVMAALDHPESSTQRVINVVLRDYGLTLKLVRAANSVHFNRTGRSIRSATHALLLLGVRTARSIASSLMLFEHYQGKSQTLKQLMLLSLLTAHHAREVALRVSGAEPEEALLAGMFRNLGEVLVAAHFPDAYARILSSVQEQRQSLTLATFNELGYQFEDLGEAMARHWGMPDNVQRMIRSATPQSASLMATITAFSHDLTNAIYRRDPTSRSPDLTAEAIAESFARYGKRLNLTRDDVRGIVEAAVRETREVFAGARVSFDALRLRAQTAAALRALGDAERVEGAAGGGADDAATTEEGALAVSGSTTPTPSRDGEAVMPLPVLREQLLAELDVSVAPATGLPLDKALLLALEALVRGGPFDRAMFAVVNPDRSEVQGRFGLGDRIDALVGRFRFPLSARGGPIGAALSRLEELVLFDERTARADELRALKLLGVRGAAIIPLLVDGKLLGCLYVDRFERTDAPDAAALAFARRVRSCATHAVDARRSRVSRAAGDPARAMTMTAEMAAVAAEPTPSSGTELVSPVRRDEAGPPPLTAAAKAALVIRLLRGESAHEVGRDAGISPAQLEAWRGEFLTGAVRALGE